jgi:hypothetical protein
VKSVAMEVLRHRVILTYEAWAENETTTSSEGLDMSQSLMLAKEIINGFARSGANSAGGGVLAGQYVSV